MMVMRGGWSVLGVVGAVWGIIVGVYLLNLQNERVPKFF
jgi:predicted benzoate:H+ symporter BenE